MATSQPNLEAGCDFASSHNLKSTFKNRTFPSPLPGGYEAKDGAQIFRAVVVPCQSCGCINHRKWEPWSTRELPTQVGEVKEAWDVLDLHLAIGSPALEVAAPSHPDTKAMAAERALHINQTLLLRRICLGKWWHTHFCGIYLAIRARATTRTRRIGKCACRCRGQRLTLSHV